MRKALLVRGQTLGTSIRALSFTESSVDQSLLSLHLSTKKDHVLALNRSSTESYSL